MFNYTENKMYTTISFGLSVKWQPFYTLTVATIYAILVHSILL